MCTHVHVHMPHIGTHMHMYMHKTSTDSLVLKGQIHSQHYQSFQIISGTIAVLISGLMHLNNGTRLWVMMAGNQWLLIYHPLVSHWHNYKNIEGDSNFQQSWKPEILLKILLEARRNFYFTELRRSSKKQSKAV